jgi:lipopolysaccharide transport system ATP-binding protein
MNMTDKVIRIEKLGKTYHIGRVRVGYRTFRESLTDAFVAPFRRAGKLLRGRATGAAELDEVIWALKDISLEVERGEVLGIIGKNGAGKTTLLKILSRITEPTEGRAEIRGRVGSLLEVGTGFHPELTGRENVFLNGAILGMKRREIGEKFDEIVAFAEIEKFIDTPVKHYSSGMYVRLAFAVAAHLEPDILLVDEVLAVGDAGFQRKCLRSIDRLTGEGRTVMLVSHNMGMVRSFSSRAVLLDRGRIVSGGETDEVISAYHRSLETVGAGYGFNGDSTGKEVWFSSAAILNSAGEAVNEVPCGESVKLRFEFKAASEKAVEKPWIGFRIHSSQGHLISHVANREAGFDLPPVGDGSTVVCRIDELNLIPGEYTVSFGISDTNRKDLDRVEGGLSFTVTPFDVFGSGMLPSSKQGEVFFRSSWSLE